MFRAVVVEDERLPRMELCSMLAREAVKVVGEAASVDEALTVIDEHGPDLVFLDIQLGRETAFDLLERTEADFDVIFVTAYDEHAIRAFQVNALDYLLKPVDPDRLKKALARMASGSQPDDQVPLELEDRLFVKVSNGWRFLKIGNIKVIQAAKDYTRLRLADGAEIHIAKPIREWQDRLPSQAFARIHRSTIVNLEYVLKVDEWFNRTYQVHVEGIEKPFSMSRRNAQRLKQ